MPRITIIIPTYNRPKSLKRILDYYSETIPAERDELKKRTQFSSPRNNDFSIMVADSSGKKNKEENKKIVGSKSALQITYLDDYSEDIVPWHKFANATQRVKTGYCLFCGDDDFISPKGIKNAVDFLEKNSDFALAQGKKLVFYKDLLGDIQWKETENCESIDYQEAASRLKKQLSDYSMATFSAVHRTDVLKTIFAETARFTDDNRFGELLPSVLALVYGKMKCSDIFYGAYEVGSKSTGIVAKSIPEFMREGSYDKKYDQFRKCLVSHLILMSGLSEDESKKMINEAMKTYLKKNYPRGYNISFTDKAKKFLGRKFGFLRTYYIDSAFEKMPDIPESLKNNLEIKNIIKYAES